MVEADADVATTPTIFPVVLYDGEREIDVGNIQIHPDLAFKQFQTMLSKLIGISYNNLTTYLVDSSKSKVSPDRRKFLITGKVNFAVIVRETKCYFLVVLKRSRRDRRRKLAKHSDSVHLHSDLGLNLGSDLSLVNRNGYDLNDAYVSVPNPYFYDDRFHDLLMHGDNYSYSYNNSYDYDYDYDYMNMKLNSPLNLNFPTIGDAYPRVQNRNISNRNNLKLNSVNRNDYHYDYMNMKLNSPLNLNLHSNLNVNFPTIGDAYPRVQNQNNLNRNGTDRSLCEECKVAQKQGKKAEFHLCVYDEVVEGWFRSPAGPVARPV